MATGLSASAEVAWEGCGTFDKVGRTDMEFGRICFNTGNSGGDERWRYVKSLAHGLNYAIKAKDGQRIRHV